MNSVIISALSGFGRKFAQCLKNSAVYRVIDKIYSAFSESWKNSAIISKIKNSGSETDENKSFIRKLVRFPFTLLEKISEKSADYLSTAFENSAIFRGMFSFLNNSLSLNTKFYAAMLVSAVIFRQLAAFSVSYPLAFAAIFGILLFFTNYNVTEFFKESKFVKFLLSLVGFSDVSFEFYDRESVGKLSTLVLAFLVGAVSGFLSTKSLIFALLPFAAIVGVTLILKYPICGVFFAAFAAPIVPTMVLAALVIYTAVCFMFEALRNKDFKWRIDSAGTGLGLFLILMLVSSVFSFNTQKSLLTWGLYLIFVGYYFIIVNAVKTKKQLYGIFKVFVIAGLFVSIYGILQYIFGWNTTNAWIDETMFEDATMRAYSTMENPNVLGEFLLFVIPISVFLILNKNAKWLEKLFWLVTAAVCTTCMIFTQSRGCWIGLIVAFAIFITFYNGRLWSLLPILLLALPFILPQTMINRFLSVGNMADSSTSYRVNIWRGTIAMLHDFWVGGIGMGEGAFNRVYPFYAYDAARALHSHNLYLQLITDGGICAFLVFMATVIIYLKKMAVQISIKGNRSNDGIFLLLCIGAVCGFMIQGMFDYTFYNYRMMAMFFMIMAFSVSLENAREACCD